MPGYQLDGTDNTNPIGLDTSNALDKQPTSSDFLGTVRVVDLPLDQSAVLLPGGIYFPRPRYLQSTSVNVGSAFMSGWSLGFNISQGNLIVAAVGYSGTPQPSTLTDTLGNTYSSWPATGAFYAANINYSLQILWAISAAGSNTITWTSTGSTVSFLRFALHEYSGVPGLTDGATTMTTGAGTPLSYSAPVLSSLPGDLLFAWNVDNTVSGPLNFALPGVQRESPGGEQTGDYVTTSPGFNSITAVQAGGGGTIVAVAFAPQGAVPTTIGAEGISFGGSGTATVTGGLPAYVQGNSFSGGGTPVSSHALAFSSNVTAGDIILVAIGWTQSGGPSSCTVTDSQSNSYSNSYPSGGPYVSGIGYLMQIVWATAGTTGPCTVTVTANAVTAPFFRMLIHEYSTLTATIDGSVSNSFGSTSPYTNTMTTTLANDLMFAWAVDNNGVTGFTSPATLRQTAGSESTGDSVATVAGSNSIVATTAAGGGGMISIALVAGAGGGGPATVTGAVTLAASAGMTVGALVTEIASVSLSGSTTLTVTPLVTEIAVVSLTGSTTMIVGGVITRLGVVPLAGSTTMTVGSLVTEVAAITEAATTGLTVGASVTEIAAITETATSGMTIGSLVTEIAAVTETATSGLTIGALVTEPAAVNETATSGLTISGLVTGANSVVLTGSTTLTVAPLVSEFAAVPLSGSTTMIVSPVVTRFAAVALAGSSALLVTPLVTEFGVVSMSALASLTTSALVAGQNSVLLSGTTTLAISAAVAEFATVSMSASAVLTTSAVVIKLAGVNMAASSALTVSSLVTTLGVVALNASTGLFLTPLVAGVVSMSATAQLATAGFVPVYFIVMSATAAMVVDATVTSTAIKTGRASTMRGPVPDLMRFSLMMMKAVQPALEGFTITDSSQGNLPPGVGNAYGLGVYGAGTYGGGETTGSLYGIGSYGEGTYGGSLVATPGTYGSGLFGSGDYGEGE